MILSWGLQYPGDGDEIGRFVSDERTIRFCRTDGCLVFLPLALPYLQALVMKVVSSPYVLYACLRKSACHASRDDLSMDRLFHLRELGEPGSNFDLAKVDLSERRDDEVDIAGPVRSGAVFKPEIDFRLSENSDFAARQMT